MKLRKGDAIVVTIGKDRGKHGTIEAVYPKKNTVLVPGVNLYKKHVKPKGQNDPGGIIDSVRPLAVTKIALVCPKCNKPTRIGYSTEGKEKTRICRKCGRNI